MGKRIPEETKAEIRRLRLEGLTYYEISVRVGVSDTIAYIYGRDPNKGPSKRRPRISQDLVHKNVELRESGKSIGVISAICGVAAGSVQYHCLKYGVGKATTQPPSRAYFRNGRPVRPFTSAEDEKIQSMNVIGSTVAEISKEVGRPRSSVMQRLNTLAKWQEAA